jgi:predicted O-methyltransferase YrrM
MISTLHSEPVRPLLERLFVAAEQNDGPILARVHSEMDKTKLPHLDSHQTALLRDAYIPVGPETGRLLYQLARARPARLIVEFGLSFGLSTIHLAAAVKDNGMGRVITTELEPNKIKRARENLREAKLLDYVEIREGDATKTLAKIEGEIDLVLLDGWKDLYLPVLQLIEPHLATGALVVADDLDIMPEALKPYLKHVRNPDNGYVSVELPLGDGLELSQWTR